MSEAATFEYGQIVLYHASTGQDWPVRFWKLWRNPEYATVVMFPRELGFAESKIEDWMLVPVPMLGAGDESELPPMPDWAVPESDTAKTGHWRVCRQAALDALLSAVRGREWSEFR